jgi:hypothetical protein
MFVYERRGFKGLFHGDHRINLAILDLNSTITRVRDLIAAD